MSPGAAPRGPAIQGDHSAKADLLNAGLTGVLVERGRPLHFSVVDGRAAMTSGASGSFLPGSTKLGDRALARFEFSGSSTSLRS